MADQDLPGYAPERPLWQPPAVIPTGSLAELARAVRDALQGISGALQQLGTRRNVVPLQGDISARPGQVISGIANGQVITLPAPDPGQYGTLTAILTGVKSSARVVSPDGSTYLLDQTGVYEFAISPDDTAWQAAPWLSSTGAGFTWSETLGAGANSGVHNPIVDVGQFMQFGLVGPTTSAPQIRSGDAVFRVSGSGQVSVIGGANAVLSATTGTASVQASAGPVTISASTVLLEIAGTTYTLQTAATTRLAISAAGEWTTPTGGALGRYLRNAGPGAPPTWANVDIGELAAIAANTVVANATAGAAAPAAVALAAQSILLRAAGNITTGTAAADTVLGRVGSGDLGFGPTPRLLRAPQVLTSGTSISHPTGTRVLVIRGVGGGGAGGGINAAAGAIGGQGGSATYGEKTFIAPSASSTYTIGAAGAGVSGAAGGNGGSSTFTNGATTVTVPGGNGGSATAGSAAAATSAQGGGPATAATNADWSIPGEGGGDALKPQAATTPCFHIGAGGSNPLGAGARSKATLTTVNGGAAGTGFGAGGNGALQGTSVAAGAGSAGTTGAWIVEEWG